MYYKDMAKGQWKKKSKRHWTCSKCGDIKKVCKHLEKLLPNQHFPNNVRLSNGLVAGWSKEYVENISDTEEKFKKILASYGIGELHTQFLTYRFVYNWTFKEICDELCIQSKGSAWSIYQKALDLLRERGFKLE